MIHFAVLLGLLSTGPSTGSSAPLKASLVNTSSYSVPRVVNSVSVQQTTVLTGIVTDQNGNPIQGVSVTEKGTNSVAITAADGRYSISVQNDTATLIFSYVGYRSLEASAAGRQTVDVVLQTDASDLDEVVVIGYQSIRKKDLTGAASVVSVKNTEAKVARSLPEALQGQSSGLVVRNSGGPGQGAVVNIRGLSTLYGNASPLYVIDGMLSDPNVTINTNDIESIQVLKDASAAAIYGARSANGVIIITTKKGKSGPMLVNASARYSVTNLPKMYDMMNGPEYVAMNSQAYANAGYTPQASVANYDGTDVNWADELFRTGGIQDYNVSISGGAEKSKYYMSGSYFKDVGTMIERKFDRAAFRINTEGSRGRVRVGENILISSSYGRSPFSGGAFGGNPFYDAFNMLPIIPIKGQEFVSEANPGGWGIGSNNARTYSRNQVAQAYITNSSYNYVKIMGNLYGEVDILDWLTYRVNAGLETSFDKNTALRGKGIWYWNQIDPPTRIDEERSQFLSYLFEHTLNFNKTIDKHQFNGVLGYTQQTIGRTGIGAGKTNLLSSADEYFTTINSATGESIASGSRGRNFIDSWLGRLNYTYDDRYLATFTFRSDKDSRFAKTYRSGFFPSGALAWRLSNEDFYNVSWMPDFKLRGSYGVLGAVNLSNYQYVGFINQAPRAVFGSGVQETQVGGAQVTLVDPNLRWEEKATLNLGFDAALFNSQFTLSVDAFRAVTSDVLLFLPIPGYLGSVGSPGIMTNIGSIENKGLEFELSYRPASTRENGFRWDISGNLSFIRNEVLSLGNLGIDPVTGLPRNYIQSGNTRTQVGRSIGEYYVILTDGLFQNQAEIDAHRAQAGIAKPGDVRYVNLLDRGTNNDITPDDRTYAGSPWPVFTSGVIWNAYYKNFTFNMQLYGVVGTKLYNDLRRDFDGMGYSNYRRGIVPWTVENPTDFPRLGVSYTSNTPGDPSVDQGIISNVRGDTDRWLENGSYLRLSNVQLGYTMPQSILKRLHIPSLQVYVSGQNLFTITNYTGLDPDVVGANANLEPGVDVGAWPPNRIFSFGISLGL
ncbi:SusC/RagA family TonB-linked outer membrane protein [Sphingobacterium deserti]|uniref:TonB-dependent receptor plug n=1 Tax=Sphingobacterium deserti TaxID=1229276 RepID=A0A0B8T923_9SPHI|nr:TonB-dependent receptor [Sphingobacterium deserti]KGE14490.1 TonB-dependent receptor plug [Sphingobacterium deserti]